MLIFLVLTKFCSNARALNGLGQQRNHRHPWGTGCGQFGQQFSGYEPGISNPNLPGIRKYRIRKPVPAVRRSGKQKCPAGVLIAGRGFSFRSLLRKIPLPRGIQENRSCPIKQGKTSLPSDGRRGTFVFGINFPISPMEYQGKYHQGKNGGSHKPSDDNPGQGTRTLRTYPGGYSGR